VASSNCQFFWSVSILVIAGLDFRFKWSAESDLQTHFVGLILVFVGYLIFSWAMASNRSLSVVVRIQQERGHSVANAGPYQVVRHPGYVGMGIT
jgi:protein-S-isoprenylcysteine O-methyltransferase Ste14